MNSAETLLIFQKPYDGKAVDSIIKNGSGALNVEGARIDSIVLESERRTSVPSAGIWGNGKNHPQKHGEQRHNPGGRWPANLLLSHSQLCGDECHAECPVRLLDEQSGARRSAGLYPTTFITKDNNSIYQKGVGNKQGALYDDTGGASRFFMNADWRYEIAEFSHQNKRKKLTSKSRTASMSKVKIVNADVIEWAKNYKGPQFHALLADVPYEQNFMNKSWDSSGIAFNPDTWRALAEHLLPGAFLFVFAGTLNDDLISVAMRQAGLRKFHKAALYWGNGAGFPKASRINKTNDRKGIKNSDSFFSGKKTRCEKCGKQFFSGSPCKCPRAKSSHPFSGHRYGLQAIKPAAETILIFCKPFEKGKKPVDSIVENGAGALNIDGGRIAGNITAGWNKTKGNGDKFIGQTYNNGKKYKESQDHFEPNSNGRWPANLLLSHSPDCNGTCSENCPCRELDEQSGERKVGNVKPYVRKNNTFCGGKFQDKSSFSRDGDTGGASRYFYQADWNHEAAEKIEQAAAVRYCAKSSRKERNKNVVGFYWRKNPKSPIGFDRITYAEWKKLPDDERAEGNIHPTVKAVSLCKYLATLLLPPKEYTPLRLLIPFAGSGSEAIGAELSGWHEIVAIEKEKEYCNIAKARTSNIDEIEKIVRRMASKKDKSKTNGKLNSHDNPFTESFESWYAKTKKYGGTREEWERLRTTKTTELFPELA